MNEHEQSLVPALDASLERVKAAYRAGYSASDYGYTRRACPFNAGPERNAWFKGWMRSERDREPVITDPDEPHCHPEDGEPCAECQREARETEADAIYERGRELGWERPCDR